jgi:hypothetical protein
MTITVNTLKAMIREAQEAAYEAADNFEQKHFPNNGWGACGFAWTSLYEFEGKKIKGNTKIGRMLKQAGIDQNWCRTFEMWNPSRYPTQNVDTLEAGARAAADVFKKYGFTAYAGSRLD